MRLYIDCVLTFIWLKPDLSSQKRQPKVRESQVTIHWLCANFCLTFFFTEDYPWPPEMLHSFFLFALLHTDMSDCLLSSLPHPLPRAPVLLQFNLADSIPSYYPMPCTISIWHCDMILPALLYNTHLRATHTTTSSIGGVQIPIYLVSSTTDSL